MALVSAGAVLTSPVHAEAAAGDSFENAVLTELVPDNEIVSYQLNDSYGDGWNGCAIEIVDTADNSTLATLTIDNGNHAEGTVSLTEGHVYQFVWKSGSYANECSFMFTSGGTTILEGGGTGHANGDVLLTYVAGIGVLTSYPLWVADTQVTNANAADVLGDGTVSYDADTHTLTLDNCVCVRNSTTTMAPIYAGDSDDPVTINLKGNSVLEGGPGDQYGIYARVDMTFTGDGSLTVTGGGSYSASTSSFGVYSLKSITLDESFTGTVVAKGGATAGQSTGFSGPYVIVNGGTLIAVGGVGVDDKSIGLQTGVSLSVTGGTVIAQGGPVAKGNSIGVNLGNNATINVSGGTFLVQGGSTTSTSGYSRGVYCSNGGQATFSGGASVVRAGAVGTNNNRFSSRNRSPFSNCSYSNSGMSAVTVGYSWIGAFTSGSSVTVKTGFACVPSSWNSLSNISTSLSGDITLSGDSYYINTSKASPATALSNLNTNGHTLFVVNLFEGDPNDLAAGLVLSDTGDVSLTGTGSVVAVGGLTTYDPSFGLYANGNLSVAGPTVIGVSGQSGSNNNYDVSDGVCCASGSLAVSSGKVIGVGSSPNNSANESHGVNVAQGLTATGTGAVVGVGGITSSSNTYGIKAQNVATQNSASVLGVGGCVSGASANSYGIGAGSLEVAGGAAVGVGGNRAAGSCGVDGGTILVRRDTRLNAVGGAQATSYSYGVSGLPDGSTLEGDAAIAGTTSAIGSSDGTLQLNPTSFANGYTDFAGTADEAAIYGGAALSTLSGYKHIKINTQPSPLTSGECGTCYWEITPDKVLMVYPGELAPAVEGSMPWIPDSEATWAISDITRAVMVSRGEAKVVAPIDSSYLLSQLSYAQTIDLSGLDTSQAQDLSYLLDGCSALEALDVSMLDTSKATAAKSMFQDCSTLGSLDLSALDMTKVVDASNMFSSCSSLATIGLPATGMAELTDASGMFSGCTSLESLSLPASGMGNIVNASGMFAGCSQLAGLDLSSLNMTTTTDAVGMFFGCMSLESLKLGSACKLSSSVALPEAPTAHPYTGMWVRQEGGEPLTAAGLMSTYDGATMAGTYVWEQIVQRTPEELEQLLATATTTAPYKDVDSVKVSMDGTDVYTVDTWVTQEVKNALIAAVATAQQVVDNEEATQEQRDVAYYALEAAMANFDPQPGTKVKGIVEVTTWSQLYEQLQDNGSSIKLTADVKFGTGGGAHESDALVVPAGFSSTLDLNGHIIDRGLGEATEAVEGGSVIDVFGELTITDSQPDATHDQAVTFADPLDAEHIVTVTGGIITGGYSTSKYNSASDRYHGGGGVLVEQDARLIMTGGSICKNRSTGGDSDGGGAGVAVMYHGVLDMSGTAAVCGNVCDDDGGGVCLSYATLNMDGNASIYGNHAIYNRGGGVGASCSHITMKGNSTIAGNKVDGGVNGWGGGIDFNYSSTLTMEDNAAITGNVAPGRGGGVSMSSMFSSDLIITMKDNATISNNTSGDFGGGVYMLSGDAVLNIGDSASISNNRAGATGGGVFMDSGSVSMTGGTISGNVANGSGGGIGLDSGTSMSMTGGTITDNSTRYGGGGVFAERDISGFTIAGTVVIDGNEIVDGDGNHVADSNLYGNSSGSAMANPITVTGALGEGSTIGIDKWGTPATDTSTVIISGFGENNPGAAYTDFFSIDDDDYIVETNDAGDVTIRSVAKYGLRVGGVQVTERNAADILGDGTASYDAATETLMLAGATIGRGGVVLGEVSDDSGIVATDLETLHIELAEGTTNTITASSDNPDDAVFGIYSDSSIIIFGTGALDVSASGQNAIGIAAPDGSVKVYDGAAVSVAATGGPAGIEANYFEARDANVTVGEGAGTGISAHGWVYLYGSARVEAQGEDYGVWCPAFLMEDYPYLKAVGTGRSAYGLHFEYGAVENQYGSSIDSVDICDYAQLEAQGVSGATDNALRTDFYDTSTTAKSLIKTAPNAPQTQFVDTAGLDTTAYYYVLMPAYRAYPVMVATPNWEEGKPYLTQVDSSNADDVFGDGTVSYDPNTNVFTLNGYHYTVGNGEQATRSALQIESSMTVCLRGENSISSGTYTTCQRAAVDANIFSLADLTFTGEGSLDIDWNASGLLDAAVVGCNVTVADHASVNVTATKCEADANYKLFAGVWAYGGDLTVCDDAILTTTVTCASEQVDDVVYAMGACVAENGKLVVSDKATLDVSGSDGAILDHTTDGLVIDYSGYEQVEGYELPMVEVCGGARSAGNRLAEWDGETQLTSTYTPSTGESTRYLRWVRIGPWEYDLWVGGTRVSMDNAADVFGDGTVSYDPVGNVLHLNGYTYEGAGDVNYHAAIASCIEGLTIDVVGENLAAETGTDHTSFGIYSQGSLAFTGAGSLTARGGQLGDESYVSAGVCVASGAMTVGEGFTGTLTARSLGGTCSSRGIHVDDGSLTVEGGNVSARAGDVASPDESITSYGIYVGSEGYIAFNGGTTSAEAGSVAAGSGDEFGTNAGIKKAGTGDIYISDAAEVDARIPQGKAAPTESCGICSDGSIWIDIEGKPGGQVVAICNDENAGIGVHAADNLSIDGAWVLFAGGAGAAMAEGITLGPDLIALGSEGLSWDDSVVIVVNEGDSLLGITDLVTSLYKTIWTQPLERYDLWVNGEQFNNMKLSIACGEGTAVFDPDAETPTLTLTNATIAGCPDDPAKKAGIYSELPNLAIKVVGENTIEPTGSGVDGVRTAEGCSVSVVSETEQPGSLKLENVDYGFNIGASGTINVAASLEVTSATGGTNVPDSAITLAPSWGYTQGTSLTQSGTVEIGQVVTVTFDGNGHGGVLATLQVPKGKSFDDAFVAMDSEAQANFREKALCELTDGGETYRVVYYYANPDGTGDVNWGAPLDQNVTVYAKWAECITTVEFTVTPPVCGTETMTAKDDDGNWILDQQTNKPEVTVISTNCITSYSDGDEPGPFVCWLEGTMASVVDDLDGTPPYQGKFVGGDAYAFGATLYVNDDYYFSSDVTVKVNGVEGILMQPYCSLSALAFVGEVTAEHVWDAGTVTTEPTYDSYGVRTYTCTGCGAKKTERIDKLQRTDLSKATVAIAGQTYTGAALTPAPTVKLGGKTLVAGTDYTTAYKNNTNAGTATVTVTGKGSYAGTATGTFAIAPASLAKATVTTVDQTHTGKALTPAPKVVLGGKTLKAGTDYTTAYKNNTNVGTATVTVTGKGNYTGTATGTFQINAAPGPGPTPQPQAADISALEAAIASVPADLSPYTDESAKAVTEALAAAKALTGATADQQAKVDAAAKALNDAVKALEEKPAPTPQPQAADISALEAAIASVPADLSPYTDESAKAVTEALAAAKALTGATADQQAKVDAAAKALSDAVAALEEKPEPAPGERAWTRLAGADRFGTMQAITLEGYDEAGTVLVATGLDFADALAAAGLSGVLKAPIVTTMPGSLSDEAKVAIQELGAKNAIILGGTSAVSADVEKQLKAMGLKVERLAGDNRIDTAVRIWERGGSAWGDTCILSKGWVAADALAAGSFAYADAAPLFLALPDGTLTPDTAAALKTFDHVVVLGGTGGDAAIKDATAKSLGTSWMRVAGDTRYETAVALATWASGNDAKAAFQPAVELSWDDCAVAFAWNYPDALVGVNATGPKASVTLLASTDADDFTKGVADAVAQHAAEVSHGYVLGGTSVISDAVKRLFEGAAK